MVVLAGLTFDSDVIGIEGEGGVMAELVRAQRLTDQEGQKLQQIVRRETPRPVACDLPPHPRDPLLPRLLLPGR